MSANAQKEVSKNQIGQWLRQTVVGQILGDTFGLVADMVRLQEDATVEQTIADYKKNNPAEREKIAKVGEAIALEQEKRKEKLESRVIDSAYTFDNGASQNEKKFDSAIKVENRDKLPESANNSSQSYDRTQEQSEDRDYQREK